MNKIILCSLDVVCWRREERNHECGMKMVADQYKDMAQNIRLQTRTEQCQ